MKRFRIFRIFINSLVKDLQIKDLKAKVFADSIILAVCFNKKLIFLTLLGC